MVGAPDAFSVVPFEPRHLLSIEPDRRARRTLSALDLEHCARNMPAGPVFTALRGGRVVGCAGLLITGDEAVGWAVLSDEVRRHPMFLHRAVKRTLDALSAGLRGIRIVVAADHRAATRWAEALGFRFTGVVPCCGFFR